MTVEENDAECIERSLERPECFEHVFNRHYSVVYSFVARQVGGDHADDVVQDVFIRAFRARRTFRQASGNARPWLLKIAANLVKDWYRGQSRRRHLHERLAATRTERPDPTDRLVERLDTDMQSEEIRSALARIPAQLREALVLFVLGELSYAEISEALSIPLGTVRSRISRARAQLGRILDDGHVEPDRSRGKGQKHG